jgi:hypothetical protein
MIAAYNRSQMIKGALCLLVGVIAYLIAWFFFRYAIAIIFRSFDWPPLMPITFTVAILALISWSGCWHWRQGGGFATWLESSLFHDLGEDTGGAVAVDHYARRVTGPAWLLGQVFLAGPLMLLRGSKHFRQRLSTEAGLEARLHQALTTLRAANRWQAITDYPDLRREILILAQMGKIDFSAHKGTPRIKASLPDGA